MNSIEKTPEEIFEALHEAASTRTKRSLLIVNNICKEQVERGSTDFSFATIGKLSFASGGVGDGAIRNKNGELYRELIGVYAHKYKSKDFPQKPRQADDWINEITDGRIKALVNIVIAEKNNYKSQMDKLKAITTLEIDMRKQTQPLKTDDNHIGLNLNRLEIEALSDAISESTLGKLKCHINQEGFVINEGTGRKAYKPAYISAIQKILTV